MKIIRNLLLGLLALIIIILVAAYFYAGALIKRGIERYVPPITGTNVSVSSVLLSPLTGSITVRNLAIGNPAGFSIPNAFSVAKIAVSVDLKSLLSDKIIVKEVSILKPQVSAEINTTGMNLTTLNNHIQKALHTGQAVQTTGVPQNTLAKSTAKKTKSVVIRRLRIDNGALQLGLLGKSQTLILPNIEQRNIGEQKSQTIVQTLAYIMSIISSESTKVATEEAKKMGQQVIQQTTEAVKQKINDVKNQVSDKIGNVEAPLKALKKIF